MPGMSVFWLRAAAALYAIGLFHTIQVSFQKGSSIFRTALIAFCAGVMLHLVAIVESSVIEGQFPPPGFHNSVSLCAFLVAVLFLALYAKYRWEMLGLTMFPLVCVMTLVAGIQTPLGSWTSTAERDTWLVIHIVLVLLGYASLLITALAAAIYLVQERQLKAKKSIRLLERLPPLGTTDALITRSMGASFILITLGVVTGSTWAFVETGRTDLGDPRLSTAMLTWVFCFLMVVLRVSAGWRGRKAALMAVAVVASSAATWAVHYVTH
jgi:ABC-type uncharacterized transport system permease subunit